MLKANTTLLISAIDKIELLKKNCQLLQQRSPRNVHFVNLSLPTNFSHHLNKTIFFSIIFPTLCLIAISCRNYDDCLCFITSHQKSLMSMSPGYWYPLWSGLQLIYYGKEFFGRLNHIVINNNSVKQVPILLLYSATYTEHVCQIFLLKKEQILYCKNIHYGNILKSLLRKELL